MATLADQIKNSGQVVKRGGQLFETAPESLFSTVQKQGAAPGAAVSPEMAAGMGVTPDQAKMAGSGAQVQKAIRESIAPGRQFKEAGPRVSATVEEEAGRKRKEELAGLEALGTRVGGIVNEAMKASAAAAPAVVPTFDVDRLKVDKPNLSESQLTKITDAITNNKVDAELYSLFNINPTDAKAGELLAVELEKYKKSPAAQVVAAAQGLLGDDVTLGQFRPEDWQALGLEGIGELASLLGETEDGLRVMPLKELQAKINQLTSADFGQVEDLQRIANDPFYPDNVRQAAQAQLRDLSSVGVQATEADMENLNEAVQAGATFTIGGKEYTAAELLSDATMSAVIKAYLEDRDGSYKKELETELPALAAFIETNKAALKASADKLTGASKDLAAVQQDNAKLNGYGPVDLKEFNKLTIEGYDPAKPSNERYQKTEAHKVFELPSTILSDADKATYATFLSQMASASPEVAKQFSGLTLDGIDALVNASGLSWNDYFKEYTNYQANINRLYNDGLSADRAIQEAFGGQQAYIDAQAQFKDALLMRKFGVGELDPASKTLLDILDANNDGQIDDPNTLREKLKTYYGSSVNVTKESIPSLLKKLQTNVQMQTGDTLYKMVQDGIIDNNELYAILQDGMMTNRVYDLLDKKTGGLSTIEGGMDILSSQLEFNATQALDKEGVTRYANPAAAVDEAKKWIDSQPKELERRPVPGTDGRFTETVDVARSKNIQKLLDKTMLDIAKANELLKQAKSPGQKKVYQTTISNLQAVRNLLMTSGSTYTAPNQFPGIAGRRE